MSLLIVGRSIVGPFYSYSKLLSLKRNFFFENWDYVQNIQLT